MNTDRVLRNIGGTLIIVLLVFVLRGILNVPSDLEWWRAIIAGGVVATIAVFGHKIIE